MLGGALGPDWHSNIKYFGNSQHKVTLETEVEIKNILTPAEVEKSKKDITKLSLDEGIVFYVLLFIINIYKFYTINIFYDLFLSLLK